MIEEQLTGEIIKIFYKIYNNLGYGFLEKVYHNAFIIELTNAGFKVESKKPVVVFYSGVAVGVFEADLVIEGKVILELKAKEALHPAHEAQLVNYLRATDVEIGLLFNFGKEPEFKRKYFSNKNKVRVKAESDASLLDNLFLKDQPESA
jgi:GxxExxY protein